MADDNNLDINIGINPAGAESGARRTSAAVGQVLAGTKDLDAAFRKLKSAIDPMYAATEKYNRSQSEYNQLLKAGKIDQAEYAKYMDILKRAYDSQVASIERNSSAAKQAAADKKALMLQEAQDRVAAANQQKAIADEWLATERRNTAALKQELAQRTLAQKAAIAAAAAAARDTATASVASTRAGGTPVTKTAEMQQVREAAAAAKRAARERVAAEQQADDEIVTAYRNSLATAKELANSAAADIVAATQARVNAEKAAIELSTAVEKAQRREATQAAREAAAAATSAANARKATEGQLAASLRERQRAEEAAAAAAARDARALNEVRASIDPAFAARERYNATMQKATSLLMQNALKTGEWTQIQRQAATQMEINARQMGRMNQNSVQLGYQMQDVTASVASGINPLVIFAQQSGQVAYAMQGMGGAAGKVAAVMGGVWFQAITLGIILLASLWEANSKAEKSTKDLMNAEDRRAMSVKELNDALETFVKTQKDANTATERGAIISAQAAVATQAEVEGRIKALNDELTRLRSERDSQTAVGAAGGSNPAALGTLIATQGRIMYLENQLKTLTQDLTLAREGATESVIRMATVLADETKVERENREAVEALQNAYRSSHKTAEDGIRLNQALIAQGAKFKAAKEAESASLRQATRDEAQYYKSRNDAITTAARALTKEGFAINPNHSDAGKIGNHPGMGNVAHADHALDVNMPGVGNEASNAAAKAIMDKMVREYQAAGFRVLWNGQQYEPPSGSRPSYEHAIPRGKNQHTDHAHLEAPANLVGKPKGMGLSKEIVGEEDKLAKEMIAIAHRTADELVETYDTAEAKIAENDQLSNEEKLAQIKVFEAKRIEAIERGYGATSKQAEMAKQHELATIKRYNVLILKEEEDRLRREASTKTAAANSKAAIGGIQSSQKSDFIDFQAQNSVLSERQALAAKRQVMREEYAAEVAHQTALYNIERDRLQKSLALPNQSKERIDQINQAIEDGQRGHMDRMAELGATFARGMAKANQDAAQVTLNSWRDVISTFTSSLSQGLQGIWMKSQTVSGALLNMADQQVFKFMDMGIQMLQNWIMAQLGMTAATNVGNATRTASNVAAGTTAQAITGATTAAHSAAEGIKTAATATGAASQTGVAAAAGMSEITTDAGVAAAGAYKSTVVIPFIGPIAAPAAAALALAAVLGFASLISAEGGMGEVPSDQLAMVHKKEMILPAWIAEPMRKNLATPSSGSMFAGSGAAGAAARMAGGGGGDHYDFHYGPSHTNMNASMQSLLRADGQTLRKWLKNEMRNGTLKMGGN